MAEDLGSMIADTGQRRTHRWRVPTYLDGWSGIRIVNNTPFNHAVRVGNRTYPIPRFSIWTCPIGHESAIDIHRIDDESEES